MARVRVRVQCVFTSIEVYVGLGFITTKSAGASNFW